MSEEVLLAVLAKATSLLILLIVRDLEKPIILKLWHITHPTQFVELNGIS